MTQETLTQACIFCQIAAGEAPCHKVWENDDFMAFLTIFPNSDGVTVVIPKAHHSSYIFDLPQDVQATLLRAAGIVAKKIDAAFPDVGRTGLIFEGFGVNHVHAKLYPMHGTANLGEWKPMEKKLTTFFTQYEGYLSSHEGERGDDEKLAEIARKIAAAEPGR